jgi:hypothetical protein
MALNIRIVAGLASVLLWGLPAEASDLAAYVGHYVYAGSQAEQQALSAEVDRAIGQLNFLLRPLARLAVNKQQLTPQSVIIRWDGRVIGIQTSPAGDSETLADGSPVTVTSQGRTITMRRFLTPRGLIAESRASEGVSTTTLTLSADRRILNLHTVLATPYVPTPISVTLTYRRQR